MAYVADESLGNEDGVDYPERKPDYVARALEAAFARTSDDRAWALVRLAADLKADERAELALLVLDEAFELPHEPRTDCAIFSCAISAHRKLEQHATAEVIEREWIERGTPDLYFARAARELYRELFTKSNEFGHGRRLSEYESLIATLSAERS